MVSASGSLCSILVGLDLFVHSVENLLSLNFKNFCLILSLFPPKTPEDCVLYIIGALILYFSQSFCYLY